MPACHLSRSRRTIRGFEVLIEREWIAMGHKFADRTGLRLCLSAPGAGTTGNSDANSNANAKVPTAFSVFEKESIAASMRLLLSNSIVFIFTCCTSTVSSI